MDEALIVATLSSARSEHLDEARQVIAEDEARQVIAEDEARHAELAWKILGFPTSSSRSASERLPWRALQNATVTLRTATPYGR